LNLDESIIENLDSRTAADRPSPPSLHWYVIRTKANREKWVSDQLQARRFEALLPFIEVRLPRWGRLVRSRIPLFPGYVFAQMDLAAHYFDIRYLAGVRNIVSAGNEALAVPPSIIAEIQNRSSDGIVRLATPQFKPGDEVQVLVGPFRSFEAIFERYLSGLERCAILLNTVEATSIRIVLPAGAVAWA
jgi:transcriptional antiterminator RfaH